MHSETEFMAHRMGETEMTTDELIARAEEREAAGHAYAAAIRAMKCGAA